jgi:hypothetical protein
MVVRKPGTDGAETLPQARRKIGAVKVGVG